MGINAEIFNCVYPFFIVAISPAYIGTLIRYKPELIEIFKLPAFSVRITFIINTHYEFVDPAGRT